jgi:HK97 family phage prohead protease
MNDELEMRRHKVQEMQGTRERRAFDGSLELRDAGSGKLGLVGWACRTNVEYEVGNVDRSGFLEVVRPSSFQRTLGNNPDVILVLNHGDAGSGLPIARTRSGTLRLSEDPRMGLGVDADLDEEDPDVQMLRRKFDRGDLDGQMSFSFRVPEGGDSWSKDFKRREITQCEISGGDVSLVSFGASPTTSAELVARRAAEAARRPLGDYGRRQHERLASMRGSSSPRPQGVLVPVREAIDPDRYRRRLDELRGL